MLPIIAGSKLVWWFGVDAGVILMNRMMKSVGVVVFVVSANIAWSAPPPVPETPASVDAVLYMQPFTLEKSYRSDWRKDRPEVTKGVIMVLAVRPELVYPRQVKEPVLYVGDETAERWNVGYQSGRVVVTVRSDAAGEFDPSATPIWFGSPAFPENIDVAKVQDERRMADEKGVRPVVLARDDSSGENSAASGEKIAASGEKFAVAGGGRRVTFKSRDELGHHIAELVRRFSPQEKDLADGLALRANKPE